MRAALNPCRRYASPVADGPAERGTAAGPGACAGPNFGPRGASRSAYPGWWMMKTDHVDERISQLVSYQRQTLELRRRAAQLRAQAELAKGHAVTAIRDAQMRRQGLTPRHEALEFEAEQARGTSELASYVAALRREQEMLREETALQDAWFRDQALDMLNQGWSRAELAEIGFGEEFLAELELLDHPGLGAPGGSPARPLPAGIRPHGAEGGLRLSVPPVSSV